MFETLKPETSAQVVEAISWATGEETPVEIVGAGTKRGFGRPMDDGNRTIAHTLDLSGLSGITLYEPEELVLSAWAGTPLAWFEAAIADEGQMLAFEPPQFARLYGGEGGTLGGMIACTLAGPRRPKAGSARDHILGIEAVTGRGDLVKSGGAKPKAPSRSRPKPPPRSHDRPTPAALAVDEPLDLPPPPPPPSGPGSNGSEIVLERSEEHTSELQSLA